MAEANKKMTAQEMSGFDQTRDDLDMQRLGKAQQFKVSRDADKCPPAQQC